MALGAARDLVDHDVRVRERVPFAFGSRAEQNRTHAGCKAHAVGVHIAGHELHRIVNRESGSYGTTGRVDVDVDVFFRVFHLKEKKLRDNKVRHCVINRSSDEDDAILEETGVNIVAAFTAASLFDDDWD